MPVIKRWVPAAAAAMHRSLHGVRRAHHATFLSAAREQEAADGTVRGTAAAQRPAR
jgi:hypothetical protein